MRTVDVERLRMAPDPHNEGRTGERLFDPCVADKVAIRGEERTLGDVTGDETARFAPGSVCSDRFSIEEVEARWREGRPQGKLFITYTDGSRLEGVMRRGVMEGLAKQFRNGNKDC